MGSTTTLNDLAVAMAKKQDHTIDALTEQTPFLGKMPLMAANKGFTHVFPEWEFIDGNSSSFLVDMNGAFSELKSGQKLESVDLFKIGGEIYCGKDTDINYPGGVSAYFASRIPAHAKRFGQHSEYELIYNYLRKRAIDSGNKINSGSAATGSVGSIVFVRFADEECMGLFNPRAFSDGFFQVEQLWGGTLGKHPTDKTSVYGADVYGYLGLLLNKGNNRYTSVIANIDSNNVPTSTQVDEALDQVRADTGPTAMVMTPRTRRFLNKYNENRIRTSVASNSLESGISRAQRFEDWDGIPMIITRNMIDTESTVSFT